MMTLVFILVGILGRYELGHYVTYWLCVATPGSIGMKDFGQYWGVHILSIIAQFWYEIFVCFFANISNAKLIFN